MIDLKDRDELPTNVVILGSIAIMICAGLFIAFAPKPKRTFTDATSRQQQSKARKDLFDAMAASKAANAVIAKQTWPGTPEEVLPLALDKVTSMAQKNHLKLIGFHPQNLINLTSVTMIPCIVNVDGPFTNVVEFEREIESAGTNLVVNTMQLSTADQESSKVTANIGIVAYQSYQTPTSSSGSPTVSPKKAPVKTKTVAPKGGKTSA